MILNALCNIAFEAPTEIIQDWIKENQLAQYLSKSEKSILQKSNSELTKQENLNLNWYLESLWIFLWVGGLIEDVDFRKPIPDSMVELCPNLELGEDGTKFSNKMKLRTKYEVLSMLDTYYRLHWWARDGDLKGYDTHPADLDIIMERRKALEWVMDTTSDWDNVNDST